MSGSNLSALAKNHANVELSLSAFKLHLYPYKVTFFSSDTTLVSLFLKLLHRLKFL